MICGSDDGDIAKTSNVMLVHKRHDKIYTASMQVCGGVCILESNMFIKKTRAG